MLRLKDIPEEKMSEVLGIATELRQREDADLDRSGRARDIAAAAAEVGVSEEHLERAAAEWHARQVVDTGSQRRRKLSIALVAASVLGTAVLLFGFREMRSVPPAPAMAVQTQTATAIGMIPGQWNFSANPGTVATVSYRRVGDRSQAAVIRVERFASQPGTPHRANLDTPLAGIISAPSSVAFDVRGQGLNNVRVYFENGALERWRSPALPASGEWRTHRLDLTRFEYQSRTSSSGRWQVRPFRSPEAVSELSFKFGDFVNPVTASGEVSLDGVIVE